jgi:hypothetical protein
VRATLHHMSIRAHSYDGVLDVADPRPSKRRRLDDSGDSETPREAEKRNEELEKELEDMRRRFSECFIRHFAAVQDI